MFCLNQRLGPIFSMLTGSFGYLKSGSTIQTSDSFRIDCSILVPDDNYHPRQTPANIVERSFLQIISYLLILLAKLGLIVKPFALNLNQGAGCSHTQALFL